MSTSRSLSTAVALALRHSRWSAEEARNVFSALDASGLTVAAFAREHDLDAQRIYAWRRRLVATTPATVSRSSSAPIRFVELPAPTPTAPPATTQPTRDQIHFPGGVSVLATPCRDLSAYVRRIAAPSSNSTQCAWQGATCSAICGSRGNTKLSKNPRR